MDFDFKTKKIDIAIPVHLLGHPCRFDMIKEMKESMEYLSLKIVHKQWVPKQKNKMVGSRG